MAAKRKRETTPATTRRVKTETPAKTPKPDPETPAPSVDAVDKKPLDEKLDDEKRSPSALAKIKKLGDPTLSPFPDYERPSREDCRLVCDALASVHGRPQRPSELKDSDHRGASCGQVPDVLDALIRTILSQNTSNANSARAKKGLDDAFGRSAFPSSSSLLSSIPAEAIMRRSGRQRSKRSPKPSRTAAWPTSSPRSSKRSSIRSLRGGARSASTTSIRDLTARPWRNSVRRVSRHGMRSDVEQSRLTASGQRPPLASWSVILTSRSRATLMSGQLFCLGRESFAVDT